MENLQVRAMVNLHHLECATVFGNDKTYKNPRTALMEVFNMLDFIKEMYNSNVEYKDIGFVTENYELSHIDEIDKSLVAKLDGKILDGHNKGEFYIEIVKDRCN